MGNISGRSCAEFETHILWSINLLANLAVYDNTWENIVEPDSLQMTI